MLSAHDKSERVTTIVVAHRLSTITNADKIIVFDQGKIVEEGTHAELMAIDGGVYRQMRQMQRITDAQDDESMAMNGENESNSAVASNPLVSSAVNQADLEVTVDAAEPPAAEKESETEDLPPVPMRRVLQLQRPEALYAAVGLLCSILDAAGLQMFAILFTEMLTVLYEPDTDKMQSEAMKFMVYFFLLAGLALLSGTGGMGLFSLIGAKLTTRLRSLVYKSILRQEIAFFDDSKNSAGRLTSRLSTDATLVHATTGQKVSRQFTNQFTILIALIIAFTTSWQLTLVVMACLPLMAISGYAQFVVLAGFSKATKEAYEGAGHVVAEAVSGIRTVAAFNLQRRVQQQFTAELAVPLKFSFRQAQVAGVGMAFSEAAVFASYAICFYAGALMVDAGWVDFGGMFRVFFALAFAGSGTGQNAAMAIDQSKAEAAKRSIFHLLDRASALDPMASHGATQVEDANGQPRSRISGAIEFRGVGFSYPSRPHAQVLRNFSLSVQPGETVALVGSSGSGKSTIVQLLERFYDPDEGSIAIDGSDIKDVNIAWLRNQIGLVSQEPTLFDDSIRYNIEYGRATASDGTKAVASLHSDAIARHEDGTAVATEPPADVVESATSANANAFIRAGRSEYNTRVGPGGSQLSGGQKQRIAIARALIRQPAVLLLDEATSALDSESEALVQQALDELLQARAGDLTTIVVAHRLSTVKNASRVVVMKDGEVVECGTPDELLADHSSQYFKLVQAQDARQMDKTSSE